MRTRRYHRGRCLESSRVLASASIGRKFLWRTERYDDEATALLCIPARKVRAGYGFLIKAS